MKAIARFASIALLAWIGGAVACSSNTPADTEQERGNIAGEDFGTLPELGARIDRMGRPEITNFLVRDPALKSLWNAEDSFAVGDTNLSRYKTALKTSLAHIDGFDGTKDMTDDTLDTMATMLIDDQLRIGMSKDCDVNSIGYFDVERSTHFARPAASCGGRSPNEDVMDSLITIFTNGPEKLEPRVTDKVDVGTGPATNAFPYLAKPHLLRPRTPPP